MTVRVRLAGAVLVALCVLLPGCGGGAARPTATAETYLDHALSLLRRHSMDVDPATWPRVVAHARGLARGAKAPADTYDAIRYAVAALEDPHTSFLTPDKAAAFNGKDALHYVAPSGRLLERRFAYIRIGSFEGGSSAIRAYVRGGVRTFARLNQGEPCGWIVDLRNNGGGNVWPMLTVVAPLLHGDPVGYFVTPDGTRLAWHARGGRMLVGNTVEIPEANRVRLTRSNPPVAVLTDYNTGSSGEAAVLAFRGQPGTRSFGLATAGFATANGVFGLSDGALLVITVALDADRTGHTYRNGDPIYPDQSAAAPSGQSAADPARNAALRWLAHSPACG